VRERIAEFKESVRLAPTDVKSERIVRIMLEECAKDCKTDMLVALGETIIEFWRKEIRDQGLRN
jgi:hypothetical protein